MAVRCWLLAVGCRLPAVRCFSRPSFVPAGAAAQAERETAVLELLRYQSGKYDEYQALVLTQMYDFKPGVLYLFEKTDQYGQIVQYYMEKKAYAGAWRACSRDGKGLQSRVCMHVEVLQACKSHGSKDRNLWVQALEYFAGEAARALGISHR